MERWPAREPDRTVAGNKPLRQRRCSSGGPLHAVHATLRHVAEPDRRLADVPVLVRGGDAERLARGASRQPRRRRRVARLHRGDRGRARRADLARRHGHLERRPGRGLGEDRAPHRRPAAPFPACSSRMPAARRAPTRRGAEAAGSRSPTAAGSRWRRARFRVARGRARADRPRRRRDSRGRRRLSRRCRARRSARAFASPRSTPRTATCCTSSSRR